MLAGCRRKLSYVVTLGERVESRLNDLGFKPAQLARHLGITSQAVSQWKTGATKDLRNENLVRSAKFLATTEEWLVFGRDPRCYPNGQIRDDSAPYPPAILKIAQAIESLPPDSQVILQKVATAFAKSTAPWDGLERRRGGKV